MKQTRMVRVWGCLVLSMTGGSALLAWLAPGSAGRGGLSREQYQSMAHEAVASRTSSGRWQAVTVIPRPGAAERRQLAAVTGDAEVHFTINRDGAVRAHPTWIEQLPLDEYREVRIELPASSSSEIAECQAVGLQALLSELQLALRDATSRGPLPVQLDRATAPQVTQRIQAQLVALIGSR